jgi:hypothetical protein
MKKPINLPEAIRDFFIGILTIVVVVAGLVLMGDFIFSLIF